MDFIKTHAKTLGAVVAGVIANMVLDIVEGRAPFPQSGQEWLRYAVTSFGAALGAYGLRNKITQSQLDKQPDIVGAVVVPAVADAAKDAAQQAVTDIAVQLPKPARDMVQQASEVVGSVVDQAIRDFQNRTRR